MKRSTKFGIGKQIGGAVYLHRQYDGVLPKDSYNKALTLLPNDFSFNIIKYNYTNKSYSFIHSPDFDASPEPIISDSILVKETGEIKFRKESKDPEIYHHKWMFVDDDYKGFDVKKSKERSLKWQTLDFIDKSRIGKKSFWDKNVIPRI